MASYREGSGSRSQYTGSAYSRYLPNGDTGVAQAGLVGAASHTPSLSLRPEDGLPGSSAHDRSRDRSYGNAAPGRAHDGETLRSHRDREAPQPATPGEDGKSHQPAQRRIMTQLEAERLRQQEGQRRQNQQLDAEMKIKSIHSRMAALEKQLFSQGEKTETSSEQGVGERTSGRVLTRQPPIEQSGREWKLGGEGQSDPRHIIIQRPVFQAMPFSIEAAEHEDKQGTTRANGPMQTSSNAADRSSLSITDSVDLDLMNVLQDIRRELANNVSHKAKGTPAQTMASNEASARRSEHTCLDDMQADIDNSLQELRERAMARDRFAQDLSQRVASGPSQPDAENSPGTKTTTTTTTTAKLFEGVREREGREGVSRVKLSNTEDPDANADGPPLVLARRAAQRSAGPPPVTGTAHNQSYKASPYAKDGRDNTSTEESGVASSASYGKGAKQSASQWGSDGSARVLDARHRQAKETHNNMDEDTQVISASAFKGYTNRTEALPPGWELKIDQPTGRKFYVNHQLKAISWDRPRVANRNNGPAQGITRSLSASMNGMQSPLSRFGSSSSSLSSIPMHNSLDAASKGSVPPALLSRESHGRSRNEDLSRHTTGTPLNAREESGSRDRVGPRYISSDRMGGSMDGAYFESEEKRRAEIEVHRRRAVAQQSGARYDEALLVPSAAPKRWTASTFFNHLQGLDASHFEEPPALAASSSSSLAQRMPLRTSLDSSRLAALERDMMEEDAQMYTAFSGSHMQSARDSYPLKMNSKQKPATATLNLLVSAKEKLRNYLFSKVDDDDLFDDSPIKAADKIDEELNYERWCAESLKEIDSDNENDDGDSEYAIGAEMNITDVVHRGRGIDSSWMRSSLTEEDSAALQAWQV